MTTQEKLSDIYYGLGPGSYSGFSKFYSSVKHILKGVSKAEAKSFYDKQTINQLHKLWYPKRIQRPYLISGINNYFTMDAFYIRDHG